jgi:hypothetical protein
MTRRDPNWRMPTLHPDTRELLRVWRDLAIYIAIVVLVSYLMFGREARAETWLNLGGASLHDGARADGQPWQAINPGAGIESTTDLLPVRMTVLAGAYLNSFGRATAYAGTHLRIAEAGPLSAGAMLARATGYTHGHYIGALTATYTAERWRIQLLGIPAITDKHVAVIAIQIGLRLD